MLACQRRIKIRCQGCGRRYVALTSSLFHKKKKKKVEEPAEGVKKMEESSNHSALTQISDD